MTSLSEVYGKRGRSTTSLQRLYLGVGLFIAGVTLVIAGIFAAGTPLLSSLEGYSLADARLYGGILGGLGVPLAMLGVFSVLPANRNTRAAAVVGASIMALGVALFAHAYPYRWIGGPRPELIDLTLVTAGVYFLGSATTFWCLFVGVANFKTRNDPGGTVTMEVTHKGETKIVEVDRGQLRGLGGIGFLGGTPDGSVETQTNDPDRTRSADARATRAPTDESAAGPAPGGSPGTPSVSDGGTDPETVSTPAGSSRSNAEPADSSGPTAEPTRRSTDGDSSWSRDGETRNGDAEIIE